LVFRGKNTNFVKNRKMFYPENVKNRKIFSWEIVKNRKIYKKRPSCFLKGLLELGKAAFR